VFSISEHFGTAGRTGFIVYKAADCCVRLSGSVAALSLPSSPWDEPGPSFEDLSMF
jgi:hypothetical protein